MLLNHLLALGVAAVAATPSPAPSFKVEKIADGVYAALRTEPPGLAFDSNSIWIVDDAGVVVVDTNVAPSSAREVIAAMRKVTNKSVTHVVNTHWHDDHHTGNAVYREAFPGVVFVGQTRTAEEMLSTGAENRAGYIKNAGGFAKHLRTLVEEKKTLDGSPLSEQERLSYLSDAVLADKAATEWAATPVITPTLTLDDKLVLQHGTRTIEVLYLGRGHTGTDLVVHLPKERILLVGDLVSWPVPLVGSTSHPADFAATLRKALELKPDIIVPGHGPVWRNGDDAYPRLVLRLLESIRDQVAAAVARGETLEQARKSVDLAEFRKTIAGDSHGWAFAFDNYVSGPGIAAAYAEASAAASAKPR